MPSYPGVNKVPDTRPRICLSRLYSSFPQLHFPAALYPTPARPLTPWSPPSEISSSLKSAQASSPSKTHLATPRLLLSLLATTSYIGHAPLMREVATMIVRTVGPATVGRYLGFAVGEGIGEEEWEGQNGEGAQGLADVGRAIKLRKIPASSTSSGEEDYEHGSTSDEDGKVRGGVIAGRKRSDASSMTIRDHLRDFRTPSTNSEPESGDPDSNLPHFYGFGSNKIGEACACWLSRWGVDLLASPSAEDIWGHRGLPARFVAALLGSDLLFVDGEMNRYRVARKVLELRRRGWEGEMEGRGDLAMGSESGGTDEWEWGGR